MGEGTRDAVGKDALLNATKLSSFELLKRAKKKAILINTYPNIKVTPLRTLMNKFKCACFCGKEYQRVYIETPSLPQFLEKDDQIHSVPKGRKEKDRVVGQVLSHKPLDEQGRMAETQRLIFLTCMASGSKQLLAFIC